MSEPAVTIIRLDAPLFNCWLCGKSCSGQFGIPIYEDLVLPNDHDGPWGGVQACGSCFRWQSQLTAPTPAPFHLVERDDD